MEKRDINKDEIKIYPIYIDKNCKVSEGRRINLDMAIENVTSEEIYNVLTNILKFSCKPEYKHHPKDYMKRGRVLVNFKTSGTCNNNIIKKKLDLLKAICEVLKSTRTYNTNKKEEETDENVIYEDNFKKRRKNKKKN